MNSRPLRTSIPGVPMTVSNERLDEMLAGLEGVTPGPWDNRMGLIRSIDGDEAIPLFETRAPWKKHRRTATVAKQEWHNGHHIARCDPDAMRSILTELRDRRASPSGVGVKGLSWEVQETKIQKLFLGFRALSAVGCYSIDDMGAHRTDDRWWLQLSDVLSKHSTSEAAKAAAEADYHTRIMSCLTSPVPNGVAVTDEMVERHSDALRSELGPQDFDWERLSRAALLAALEGGSQT